MYEKSTIRGAGRPPTRRSAFIWGVGCGWIHGLMAQKPCAMGIQAVHGEWTLVDSSRPPGRSAVLVVDLLALGLDAGRGGAVVGGRGRGGGVGAVAGAVGIGRAVALVAAGGEAEGQTEGQQDLVHRDAPSGSVARGNGSPRAPVPPRPVRRLLEGGDH